MSRSGGIVHMLEVLHQFHPTMQVMQHVCCNGFAIACVYNRQVVGCLCAFCWALGIGGQWLVFSGHMQLHVLGHMCCICDFDVFIGAAACGPRKALVTHEDIMQSGLACLMIVPVHGW